MAEHLPENVRHEEDEAAGIMEGLEIATPVFTPYVIPIAVAILVVATAGERGLAELPKGDELGETLDLYQRAMAGNLTVAW